MKTIKGTKPKRNYYGKSAPKDIGGHAPFETPIKETPRRKMPPPTRKTPDSGHFSTPSYRRPNSPHRLAASQRRLRYQRVGQNQRSQSRPRIPS